MKVNHSVLFEKVGKCMAVLGKGSTNPFNFFEICKLNNKTYVGSANSQMVVLTPLGFDFPECKIPGEFYQLLQKLKAEELDLDIKDNFLLLRSKNSVTELVLVNKKFSVTNLLGVEKAPVWKDLPSNFCECLSMCGSCTSITEEKTDYVYFDKQTCVATNKFEVISAELTSEMQKMFVRGIFSKTVSYYKPIQFDIFDEANWNVYRCEDDTVLFVRTLKAQEKYPLITNKEEYTDEELSRKKSFIVDNLFNVNGSILKLPDKSVVENLVKSCKIFSAKTIGEEMEQITVKIGNNYLQLEAQGILGRHKVRTAYPESNGVQLSFSIHPQLFMDILTNGSECVVGERAIVVKTDNFKHWILLNKRGA